MSSYTLPIFVSLFTKNKTISTITKDQTEFAKELADKERVTEPEHKSYIARRKSDAILKSLKSLLDCLSIFLIQPS